MTQSGGAAQPIVRMVRISKSFTGTDAVRNVDLEFFPGEVHGLVGENGAGKSTLMRVLAGMYADYSGEIFLNGSARRIHSPRLARELGIAMVPRGARSEEGEFGRGADARSHRAVACPDCQRDDD